MTSSASRFARRPHRSRLVTTVWRGSGLDSRRRRPQLQPMTARSRYEALGQPAPTICVPAMDTASISRRGRTDLISRLTVLSVRQDRAARLGNNLPQCGDVLRERDAPGRRQPSRSLTARHLESPEAVMVQGGCRWLGVRGVVSMLCRFRLCVRPLRARLARPAGVVPDPADAGAQGRCNLARHPDPRRRAERVVKVSCPAASKEGQGNSRNALLRARPAARACH
jgi:hypothetical protein